MPSFPKFCPHCNKYFLFSTFEMIQHNINYHKQINIKSYICNEPF